MRKFILTGTILYSAIAGFAQDSLKTLNEIVITATRSEQEIIDVARSVEIIDQAEIRESAYSSVGELLSQKTSLYVVGSTQTPGTNQDVFLRGANSNHITVLIDGVRVTDSSSPNSAFNLAELSLANVERIEIVYGAHSTLYGTAALGGTINIITRNGEKGLNGFAGAQAGAFNAGQLLEGTTYISYGFENGMYISGSAFHQQVNGLNAAVDTLSTWSTADKDGFVKTDISVKTGYKGKDLEGHIEYKRADQKSEIDDGAFDDDDNYVVDLTRDFLNYGLNYNKNKFKLSFIGGYSHSERTAENDSSVIDNNHNYDRTYFTSAYEGAVLTNELLLNYKTGDATFIFGLGNYGESMDFSTYYFSNSDWGIYESEVNYDSLDLSSSIQHVFLSGSYNPSFADRLNISYGIRLNHHSKFGSHFTWEVNPSFRILKSATFYASYSKGFNAPSLYQLYDPTQGAVTARGNENLKPEEGRSFEIGWKQILGPDFSFTLSLFDNRVKDAIEYVYIWDGSSPVDALSYEDYLGDTYINVNEQHIRGAELNMELSLLQKVKLRLNTSYLDARTAVGDAVVENEDLQGNHLQVYSNGAFVGNNTENKNLVRRPSWLLNAGVNYMINNATSFQVDYQFIGSRNDAVYDPALGPFGALSTAKLSSYHLFNLTGRYKLNKNFNITATIKNLLNADYNEIYGFNSMGRGIYLKVIYEF